MKVALDTNVLVRLVMGDDRAQQARAVRLLASADQVAIGVHTLCEFAWVLGRAYEVGRADIAEAIRRLLGTRNVVTNRPVVEAGLATLAAGGDFADGVIAAEGRWLGGETFVSFDRKAVELLGRQGGAAMLLA